MVLVWTAGAGGSVPSFPHPGQWILVGAGPLVTSNLLPHPGQVTGIFISGMDGPEVAAG